MATQNHKLFIQRNYYYLDLSVYSIHLQICRFLNHLIVIYLLKKSRQTICVDKARRVCKLGGGVDARSFLYIVTWEVFSPNIY